MKRPDWLKLSPPVVFGLVAVGVLGLGWVVIYLPQLQTAPLSQKIKGYETSSNPDTEKLATLEKGRLDSENAIRTGLIQGLGGTAVLIGIYFTYRNLRTAEANLEATQRNVLIAAEKQATERKTAEANLKLAEDKQVTERFGKAVEMLSSGSMHTRLGGIYALERIANDSDKDYWQVMEVLTAFVREESPWPPKPKEADPESTTEVKMPESVEALQPEEEGLVDVEDIQAAIKISEAAVFQPELLAELLEREQRRKKRNAFLSVLPPLRTDIQAVMTVIGRRQHRFNEGETQRLDLSKADLRRLQAAEASLSGIDLSAAHLERADLSQAHLEGADLSQAHLEGANLSQAHLEGANLSQAHLERANLSQAHLERAYLWNAHLEGANLAKDLSQVRQLTQEQIDSALTDKTTILPDYL